jgi:pimeloyl-ACP methyl ester carboxylesterase
MFRLGYFNVSNNKLSGRFIQDDYRTVYQGQVDISNNRFTFDGIEDAFNDPKLIYVPQGPIQIYQNDSLSYVNVGGTRGYNTYYWYIDGVLQKEVRGDSSFRATKSGKLSVEVRNYLARSLVLRSEEIPNQASLRPVVRLIEAKNIIVNGISTEVLKAPLTANAEGIVADGASRVVIQLPANIPVEISCDAGKGSIADFISPDNFYQSIAVTPVDGRVTIIFRAPNNLEPNLVNPVSKIRFEAVGFKSSSIDLKLFRAPVVLVHGMWSSPAVWEEGGFRNYLRQQGFDGLVLAADYGKYSHLTFDPQNEHSIHGRNAILLKIKEALQYYQSKSIAISKVDIVAHSLGGLMTRSLMQNTNYVVAENFFEGFVHRFITIGTPHFGSPLGPLLWKNRINKTWAYIGLNGSWKEQELGDFVAAFNFPIGSSHFDFDPRLKKYASLKTVGTVQTHAITASYNSKDSKDIEWVGRAAMGGLLKLFGEDFEKVFSSECGTPLDNDLIVPVSSQQGGIEKSSFFTSTGHSLPAINTETKNPLIHERIYDLLVTSQDDQFDNKFATRVEDKPDCLEQPKIPQNAVTGTFGTFTSHQTLAPTIGLKIDRVQSQFVDDSTFKVVYTIPPAMTIVSGVIMTQDGTITDVDLKNPYQTTINISATLAGKLTIGMVIKDQHGEMFSDTFNVIKKITAFPARLYSTIESLQLDSSNTEINITVYLQTGDNPTPINVSDLSTGTKYSLKKNNGILQLTENSLRGLRAGVDTLLITYQHLSFSIPVIVQPNITLFKKLPNTLVFTSPGDQLSTQSDVRLEALSSSGETIIFSIVSGPAEISGRNLLLIKGPGKVVVRAADRGNALFAEAIPQTKAFCINPSAPIFDSTNLATCQGITDYKITGATGVTYVWKDGNGVRLGQGTTLRVNWTQSGNKQISISPEISGCVGPASNLNVIIRPTPATPIVFRSDSLFCDSDSIKLETNATGAQWFFTGQAIIGATSSSLFATKAGKYTVTSVQDGCTSLPSVSVELVEPFKIIKPIIKMNGSVLQSSYQSGNTWYRNDSILTGETNNSISPTVAGSYRVKATINGCTSPLSDALNHQVTSTNEIGIQLGLSIHPNPFRDNLFIKNPNAHKLTYAVYALDGRLLRAESSRNILIEVDLSAFVGNACIVTLIKNNQIVMKKILVKN